jgi:hypothetical protein
VWSRRVTLLTNLLWQFAAEILAQRRPRVQSQQVPLLVNLLPQIAAAIRL